MKTIISLWGETEGENIYVLLFSPKLKSRLSSGLLQ